MIQMRKYQNKLKQTFSFKFVIHTFFSSLRQASSTPKRIILSKIESL